MSLIGYLRQKFVKVELPNPHEKALELSLHPQPWWNTDFYQWAIDQEERKKEREHGQFDWD